MAKKKKNVSGTDIDWYLISIDRLKQIGLVVLLLLLTGGGYWFYSKEKGNPRTNADHAISDARQTLNSLAASPNFATHRSEFDRASRKLEEARTLFGSSKYPESQGAAVESQTISRTAIAGGDRENDAPAEPVVRERRLGRALADESRNPDRGDDRLYLRAALEEAAAAGVLRHGAKDRERGRPGNREIYRDCPTSKVQTRRVWPS